MKHPTTKPKGAKRVLNYAQIRKDIEANLSYSEISKNAGCSKHHVWRLKKQWGLIPDKWAVEL